MGDLYLKLPPFLSAYSAPICPTQIISDTTAYWRRLPQPFHLARVFHLSMAELPEGTSHSRITHLAALSSLPALLTCFSNESHYHYLTFHMFFPSSLIPTFIFIQTYIEHITYLN